MDNILDNRKLAINALNKMFDEYYQLSCNEQGIGFFGFINGLLEGLLIGRVITEKESEEIKNSFEQANKGHTLEKPTFIQ